MPSRQHAYSDTDAIDYRQFKAEIFYIRNKPFWRNTLLMHQHYAVLKHKFIGNFISWLWLFLVSTLFVQNLNGLLNEEWQTEPKIAQGTVFVLKAIDICSLTLYPISIFDFRFRFRPHIDFRYACLHCAASSLVLQPFKFGIGVPHDRLPFCSLQCSSPSFYTHISQVHFDIILPP